MGKTKNRDLKRKIQELMDRTAMHEREYVEQPGQDVPLLYFYEKFDAKQSSQLEREIRQLSDMLRNMSVSYAPTEEDASGGKLPTRRELAEYLLNEAGKRAVASEPPKPAEYLAYLFLPKADRDNLLGDLTEKYPKLVKKFGQKWAQFYFYKQVIWSIWPLVRKAIIKWGLFGWVVELIRRISS